MYAAARVLQTARDALGVDIRHVLLATDEEDPKWMSVTSMFSRLKLTMIAQTTIFGYRLAKPGP